VGHQLSDQTVGNILLRHGLGPAPERKRNPTWTEFIRRHKDVLWATDFFTTEVWTATGLTTSQLQGGFHKPVFVGVSPTRGSISMVIMM
jgi:hypothetical protein